MHLIITSVATGASKAINGARSLSIIGPTARLISHINVSNSNSTRYFLPV